MWSRRGKHGPGIDLRMLGISSETRMVPFLYRILFPWNIPQLLLTLRYTLFPCTECCFGASCLWTCWFLWLEHPSFLYLTNAYYSCARPSSNATTSGWSSTLLPASPRLPYLPSTLVPHPREDTCGLCGDHQHCGPEHDIFGISAYRL